jgi:Rrf2 family protein
MRISARTDYGLRVLLELAQDSSAPMTCEAIAASQDIPYRFLKSIVQDLRRAGLVVSQRGCDGGYWLAQDPVKITVADVIRAVDGHVLTVRGEVLADLDYTGPAAHVGELWADVSRRVNELFSVTIAALLSGELARPELAGSVTR